MAWPRPLSKPPRTAKGRPMSKPRWMARWPRPRRHLAQWPHIPRGQARAPRTKPQTPSSCRASAMPAPRSRGGPQGGRARRTVGPARRGAERSGSRGGGGSGARDSANVDPGDRPQHAAHARWCGADGRDGCRRVWPARRKPGADVAEHESLSRPDIDIDCHRRAERVAAFRRLVGTLAVVPPQDGADTARTEGTLRVTDTCVFLDTTGGPVVLVWPADRTTWNAEAGTIAFANVDGSTVSVGDGTRVVLGGGGDSNDESGTTTEDWLARTTWVARPDTACPLDARWWVGAVTR